jgi:hypothetical protein
MHQHHLHHAITSYCIMTRIMHHFALIHTLEKQGKLHVQLRQKLIRIAFDNGILCNVFGKNYTVASKKGDFFLKREKKGRFFFVADSKMVCTKVPRITKKYITSTYMQIVSKPRAMYKDTKLSKIHSFSLPLGLCQQLRQ